MRRALTPSISAARSQGLGSPGGCAAGAVSARWRWSAAAIAAASSGEAPPPVSSIRGRGGRRLPLLATGSE